ncbi:MAG: glycosyltransferase family 2 protein [Chitinophagaceae bacterium]|nr:glycosyltransferase family 2 protein [Chitinophagaceae bacterium]
MEKKLISIVSPCYNEQDNIRELHKQVQAVIGQHPNYSFEHIFIDNDSTDDTVDILRELAADNKSIKVILNNRNYGHITSPYHGMLSAKGDAVILLVSDLQDPPAMISDFIKEWESGYKITVGVKENSDESALLFFIRKSFYNLMNRLSTVKLIKNYTGFGLYDKKVMDHLRSFHEPYPYFRGLVMELGYPVKQIKYRQPVRHRGISKNNFYTLYDIAMLGITSHSLIPLRLATMTGFFMALVCLLISLGYLVYKLLYWNKISLGIAPLIVGGFFIFSILLFFIGILGEYVINLQRYAQNRPHVIEKERINF